MVSASTGQHRVYAICGELIGKCGAGLPLFDPILWGQTSTSLPMTGEGFSGTMKGGAPPAEYN
jgi:hypothetical protein